MVFISGLHSAVFGIHTVILIFAFFLFVNFKTRFIGIRKSVSAVKALFCTDKNNGNSPLKAICISLCATVGTGNIVGVAGAVALGGAGAVFWMWVSGILALSVKFSEIYLSSLYKNNGGAFSYIYSAFPLKQLKTVFLTFGLFTALGIGNLTQTNAAAGAVAYLFVLPQRYISAVKIILGIVFCAFCLVFLWREYKAIKFCEAVLPLMAAGYVILCVCALFKMRAVLPSVFAKIAEGAFCPRAVTGGAIGSAVYAVKSGLARGIFSNEAGLSTGTLAYEKSEGSAVYLSLFGIAEVIVDTLVLCTLTALVVISSKNTVYGKDLGVFTTLSAFSDILGKGAVYIFCVMVCFFAFSSVIGWGIYARRFAISLKIPIFLTVTLYSSACIWGAVFSAEAVWKIAEIVSVLMMTVNCSAIIYHRKELSGIFF